MAWRIEFGADALRDLKRIGRSEAARIIRFMEGRVAERGDPRELATPMKGGAFAGMWRFRAGDYRVIAEIRHSEIVILVIAVGHRRNVYREKR